MKKIILYFQDKMEKDHPMGEVQNKEEAWELISVFLMKHYYKAPYVREWDEPEKNQHWWDVGSHTEFFYTQEAEIDELLQH